MVSLSDPQETADPAYSIVVPIYNDGALSPALCEEIQKTFTAYLGTDDIADQIELIFVNDGSRNDSLNYLNSLAAKYGFVRVIDLYDKQ